MSEPKANGAVRRLGAGWLVGAIIRVNAAAAAQGERAEYRIDNFRLLCKRGSATKRTRENVAKQSNDRHPRPVCSTLAELSHVGKLRTAVNGVKPNTELRREVTYTERRHRNTLQFGGTPE